MDQRLAEIYHTNEEGEADVEKLAAAQLAEELEDNDAIDLDGLDEEQLNALAEEVLGEVEEPEEGEAVKTAEDEEAEEEEETEDEPVKLAEADFQQADQMGRIMAHAFVQEHKEIEKSAGALSTALKSHAHKAGRKAVRGVEWVGKKLTPKKLEGKVQKSGKMGLLKRMRKGGMKPSEIQETIKTHAGKRAIAANKVRRTHNLRKAVGGGAIATTVGGGAAAEEGVRKHASAIDTLAMQRAEEMLAASQVEETRSPYDVLGEVVEQRAHEILAENGYEMVEEPEETQEAQE